MSSGSPARIDLAASAARVQSSRRLAAEQARLVDAAQGRADNLSIDLLYTLEESVLVFTETHRMLEILHERELRADAARDAMVDRKGAPAKVLVLAQIVALAILAACLIEIADPAPMDVRASSQASTLAAADPPMSRPLAH